MHISLVLWLFAHLSIENHFSIKHLNKQDINFCNIMRQLKGKTKETNKQKKERKKEFLENKQRIFTVVLPTMAAIFVMIAAYVYIKTRPKVIEY
ncbi:single-pass membrane and coiled-coil domain-containing protein 4 homolog [Vespa mandarinia]|uniref:single-pass membrane and coiled-coil domain-containing protein 4 homolog n=1 Tax=Vespa mandarinia TaxID=7446 RepID=UPI00161757C9|nr:single-pass membrane and coiled-coil domain-containing protein 4 homolog [Vespa mandarinia]XP_047363631.1 single-pass membrane and coiled-coil domain-containing protein 4 homolog [Vespa velutina]